MTLSFIEHSVGTGRSDTSACFGFATTKIGQAWSSRSSKAVWSVGLSRIEEESPSVELDEVFDVVSPSSAA
eukprot:scaffold18668_cov164-Amphora_coffeaeformis.AAC.9